MCSSMCYAPSWVYIIFYYGVFTVASCLGETGVALNKNTEATVSGTEMKKINVL